MVGRSGSKATAWRKKNLAASIIHRLRFRARKYLRKFTITEQDLLPLPSHCPILGIELNYKSSDSTADNNPSLDRVLNDGDYVVGNVAIISNRAK